MSRLSSCLLGLFAIARASVATDTLLSRESAIGPGVPEALARTLDVREVPYLGFDGRMHRGQIVCARSRCQDLSDLFDTLARSGFPLRSVVPVAAFGGSDSASMAADNTSCFAWRGMWGSETPSSHAKGLALDVNPRENPAFHRGRAVPAGATRDLSAPGTLSDTSLAVLFLRHRGWHWGAHWRRVQDWQHFEAKP
jgi:peptidoglycan LD-endopeptidase CwlK